MYPFNFLWGMFKNTGQAAEIRKLWIQAVGFETASRWCKKLTGLRLWDQQKGRENRPGSESEWQISQMDTN